jgi:hypothetical protein
MNNFKTIITVLTISLSTVFATVATEKNATKDNKSLRSEIVSLLGTNIPIEINKSESAVISFIINNNNEVIVVTIDSENTEFSNYVKSRLNYKKINLKNLKKGEIYRMPVKIKKQ